MLANWTELLPLFIVRWLATRHCERWMFFVGSTHYRMAMARPDVLFKLPDQDPKGKQ